VALSFILAPVINELTFAQASVDATPADKTHIVSLVENGASAFHKDQPADDPDTASRAVRGLSLLAQWSKLIKKVSSLVTRGTGHENAFGT